MTRRTLAAALTSLVLACASTQERGEEPKETAASAEATVEQPLEASPADGGSTASAPVAPPKPDGRGIHTCSAAGKSAGGFSVLPGDKAGFGVVPLTDPNAPELAAALAKKDLRERICGEVACPEVEARILLAYTGPMETPHYCAMALVSEATIAQHFKTLHGSPLDEQLAKTVASLYSFLETQRLSGGEVTIDKVIDHGHPGTPRSNFLKDRLTRALFQQRQVLISSPPKSWSGKTLPPGFSAVIRATVTTPVKRSNKLDVSWEALVRGTRGTPKVLPLPITTVSAEQLPDGTLAGTASDRSDWPKDDSLTLRIDAAPGGSLCPGERTQLTAWSSRTRNVQIYSLFGDGRAMLIYPNAENPTGQLPGRNDTPIGTEEGFSAQPLEGEKEELFLVLGAGSAGEFGPRAKWVGPCMVPSDYAKKLFEPAALPASLVKSSTAYQIASGPKCEGLPPVQPTSVAELEKHFPPCQ